MGYLNDLEAPMLFLINPRISFDTLDSFCWFPNSCKYKMYKLTSSASHFRKTPKAVNISHSFMLLYRITWGRCRITHFKLLFCYLELINMLI